MCLWYTYLCLQSCYGVLLTSRGWGAADRRTCFIHKPTDQWVCKARPARWHPSPHTVYSIIGNTVHTHYTEHCYIAPGYHDWLIYFRRSSCCVGNTVIFIAIKARFHCPVSYDLILLPCRWNRMCMFFLLFTTKISVRCTCGTNMVYLVSWRIVRTEGWL